MHRFECSDRAKHLGVILVTLGLFGCQEDDPQSRTCLDLSVASLPDIPILYTTEHLEFHVPENQMFCAGSAEEYERHFVYTGLELGVELRERVPVFILDSVAEYCPEGTAGCVRGGGVVYSELGHVAHELGHVSTCELQSNSSPYLSEGLAESFEVTPSTTKVDPAQFVEASDLSPDDYDGASHFVRWLIEERGVERFLDLFLRSPLAGGDGVYEALASVYGQDAEALFADYEATAPFMWVPHRQCADLEILHPQAGIWQFEAVFDCEVPATLGPYERAGDEAHLDVLAATSMYQSFLIEVASAGSYRFSREVETIVEIERCVEQTALSEAEAEQLWHRQGLLPTLQGTTDVELRAGTYRVDVRRQFAAPHPVSLRIEPL